MVAKCQSFSTITNSLIKAYRDNNILLSTHQISCLDWNIDDSKLQLLLLWSTAIYLQNIQTRLKSKKQGSYQECRAELLGHARVAALTSLKECNTTLVDLIMRFFSSWRECCWLIWALLSSVCWRDSCIFLMQSCIICNV